MFEQHYMTYIKREGATELLEWLRSTDFFKAPASTRFHGDHEGGLVEHSLNVFKRLCQLVKLYDINVSAESVAIVALLHDVCKVNTYEVGTRNVKNARGMWETVPTYNFKEQFSFGGHGSKSLYLVQKFMKLTDEEAVAINCHMGAFDRSPGDYSIGDAFENHPLAFLLHVADCAATYFDEKKEK